MAEQMERILIVEDERIIARHIQAALEVLGYTTVGSVATGLEAIEAAEHIQPDLVLMDIRLRGSIDGITAAEEIYERFKIPVVYLTAHADVDTLQSAKLSALFGYVIKPFQRKDLHTAIEVALHRHRTEQQLRAIQQQFVTTLNSLGDAAIAADANGVITFMNPVAEALTGWQQQEVLGQSSATVLNLVQEETRRAIDNPLAVALQQGETVSLPDHAVLVTKDGTEKPVGDKASPIKNSQGEIIGSVLLMQDVTEQRQAQAILINQFQQQTERLDRAIEHIQMLKQLLEQIPNPSDAAKVLQTTVAQLEKVLLTEELEQ